MLERAAHGGQEPHRPNDRRHHSHEAHARDALYMFHGQGIANNGDVSRWHL